MRKKSLLIGAVAFVVLVGGGLLWWYVTQRPATDGATATPSPAEATAGEPDRDEQTADPPAGDPADDPPVDDPAKDHPIIAFPPDSQPYEGVGIMTGAQGSKHDVVFKYDGKGNSMLSGDWGTGRWTVYIFGDEGIVCNDAGCRSAPATETDTASFALSEEHFGGLSTGGEYRGSEPCGQELCQVWEKVSDDRVLTLHLGENHWIRRITIVTDGVVFTDTEYTYGPVTIERPENVTR